MMMHQFDALVGRSIYQHQYKWKICFLCIAADVDECLVENGNCSHRCVNDLPGYHCECDSGDVLHPNELTCIPNANCTGDLEMFRCECLPGYEDTTTGDNFNCTGTWIYFILLDKLI